MTFDWETFVIVIGEGMEILGLEMNVRLNVELYTNF